MNNTTKKKNMQETMRATVLLHGIFYKSTYDLLVEKEIKECFVMEGRPNLKSSKYTCKELQKRGIQPIIITDNMVGSLFYQGLVTEAWGAHQFSDQSGALCRVGTLILGVLCKSHKIALHLYPSKTEEDRFLGIPADLTRFAGQKIVGQGTPSYIPLVNWVPKKYIKKLLV